MAALGDIDGMIDSLGRGDLLTEKAVEWICSSCIDLLCKESNVIFLPAPITICGDIHGQFSDLPNLFQAGGDPRSTTYLFLGDYVDRGSHGLSVILTLCLYKLRDPSRMFLLRGNHESRRISLTYGFYEECQRKYGQPAIWTAVMEMFDYFPIAAVIDNHVFAVHGGLSPHISTIAQIQTVDRIQEIPEDGGPMHDFMWSDPAEEDDFLQQSTTTNSEKLPAETEWLISPRGGGFLFGEKPTQQFLSTNGLDLLVRSHQLCDKGYRYYFHQSLLTIWSAPNYCYRCGNNATVCRLQSGGMGAKHQLVSFIKGTHQEEEEQRAAAEYFM